MSCGIHACTHAETNCRIGFMCMINEHIGRSLFGSGWSALRGALEARPLIAGCLSLQRLGVDLPVTHPSGIRTSDLLHLRADLLANCDVGATM